MVTPAAKRQAVAHACAVHGVSERRACRILGVDRASMRYRSRRAGDTRRAAAHSSTGAQAASLRLPSLACVAETGGMAHESQTLSTALP